MIIATGAVESRPKECLYGEDERVITQLELERRLSVVAEARNPGAAHQISAAEDRGNDPVCGFKG